MRQRKYLIKTYNDSQTERSCGEEKQRDLIPVFCQPASHPAKEKDSAGNKGPHIEESVGLVSQGGLGLVGDDEELPGVQEDGVNLHNQGESPVGDVLLTGDCEAVAEDHTEVMDQKLVAAPLPMVDHHVQGVVEEVPDGEADEDMAGVGEGPDQVVPHLRSLKYRVASLYLNTNKQTWQKHSGAQSPVIKECTKDVATFLHFHFCCTV